MRIIKSSSGPKAGGILIIGDVARAFVDPARIKQTPCETCTDIADGIEIAAQGGFSVIAVAMSGTPGQLSTALKTIRQANAAARIIILAQMYQEPAALKLLGSVFNGSGVANDYLIYPVSAGEFFKAAGLTSEKEQVQYDPSKIRYLEELATVDELTGLKNRRYMWEFARQIIEHAQAENGRVTLLLFDIDNFKHYNDVYDHSAGDEVLKQAAVLMRRCCRPHDVVGRIGGDEFAVVFWDDPNRQPQGTDEERRSARADHPSEPIFIAKRFRRELKKTELDLLGPDGKGELTISGGLASFPRDGLTIDELFRQADKALLEAKRSGKNRVYLVGKSSSDIEGID